MAPDPPGIPRRHQREPDLAAERERLERAVEHVTPPPPQMPIRTSLPPQQILEELGVKRWQIILAIVTVVGGMFTTCTTAIVTIATASKPADPRIDTMMAKVAAIERRLEMAGSSDTTIRLGVVEHNAEFLAEAVTKLNGQPLNESFPAPRENAFQQSQQPEPVPLPKFTSTRQWRATKPD